MTVAVRELRAVCWYVAPVGLTSWFSCQFIGLTTIQGSVLLSGKEQSKSSELAIGGEHLFGGCDASHMPFRKVAGWSRAQCGVGWESSLQQKKAQFC